MADAKTEQYVTDAKTGPVPFIPGDVFAPVEAGKSDLNLHMLDMLDDGDRDSDPFKAPGSIPGEPTPTEVP
jgi:hypothetical protein